MLAHDELYHYGVRGMRWGVRKRVMSDYIRNSPQLNRANQAANRLNAKISNASDFSDPAKRKKAYKIGGAVLGGAALAAGVAIAIKNPKVRNRIARATWTAKNQARYSATFDHRVSELNRLKTFKIGADGWNPKHPMASEIRSRNFEYQGKAIKDLLDQMANDAAKNPKLVALNKGW